MAGAHLTKVLCYMSVLLGQLLPQEPADQCGINTTVLLLGSTDATHMQQTKPKELSSSTSNYCCKLTPATKTTWRSQRRLK